MKKLYYLSTCDICKRIIKELELSDEYVFQDIKNEMYTSVQLDEMKALSGSYESLFNKRARLYKEQGLKEKHLLEADYKTLLLSHYTFLKRPVLITENHIFIGNSKKTIAIAKGTIHE